MRCALGVRRVVGEINDCGGIGRREQHFMTPPVLRQIDCHLIEIGEWIPDLSGCCAPLELEIGAMERLRRGTGDCNAPLLRASPGGVATFAADEDDAGL